MTVEQEQLATSYDGAIVKWLGLATVLGLLLMGAVMIINQLQDGNEPLQATPLVAVTSGAIGALASRLTGGAQQQKASGRGHEMEVLGSAVSSTLIAQMMKTIAEQPEKASN
jgi:hypothetical protein